jgi:hypothetical protein
MGEKSNNEHEPMTGGVLSFYKFPLQIVLLGECDPIRYTGHVVSCKEPEMFNLQPLA